MDRYLDISNIGSAKVPSTLCYDHDGGFCGIDNGVDFQDDDEFLKLRWYGTVACSPPRVLTAH